MSRFSKNSARAIGYAFFALAGGAAYVGFYGMPEFVTDNTLENSTSVEKLPITLGATGDYATELSAVMTRTRFDDPVVELTPTRKPHWIRENNFSQVESLTKNSVEHDLPKQYPYQKVAPISIPRRGDAVVNALAVQPTNAPELKSLGPERPKPYTPRPTFAFNDDIPTVPVQGLGNSNANHDSLAVVEPEGPLTWPDRGLIVLDHLKKGFFPASDNGGSSNSAENVAANGTPPSPTAGADRPGKLVGNSRSSSSIASHQTTEILPPTMRPIDESVRVNRPFITQPMP